MPVCLFSRTPANLPLQPVVYQPVAKASHNHSYTQYPNVSIQPIDSVHVNLDSCTFKRGLCSMPAHQVRNLFFFVGHGRPSRRVTVGRGAREGGGVSYMGILVRAVFWDFSGGLKVKYLGFPNG
jgi:hypothetical protein